MVPTQDSNALKLRPHHIYCAQFTGADLSELGEEVVRMQQRIMDILKSGTAEMIEVIDGVDDLCQPCPLRQGNLCRNPQTGEERLKKLGAILLQDLGISYGDRLTAQDLRALINRVSPLPFCQTKCKQKETCGVFRSD